MQKIPVLHSKRAVVSLLAAAALMPLLQAGEGDYPSGLAGREAIRRQQAVAESDQLLLDGRTAYAAGDYEKAVNNYKQALAILPHSPVLADRRAALTQHLSDGSVALSGQYRRVGKYAEARALLENVTAEDPSNTAAKKELGFLDDPIRTNPALTYEHTQNVDAVRRALYMGEGQYNLGKYDAANKEFERVLRIDPYNRAARRWMEKIAQSKSNYYKSAYDHTRAELLSQVDAAWELAVPDEAPTTMNQGGQGDITSGSAVITNKLNSIIIPQVDFDDTSVEDAVDFLRARSKELDNTTAVSLEKGVNFVVRKPRTGGGAEAAPAAPAGGEAAPVSLGAPDPNTLRIKQLRLSNAPLVTVLKYVCDATRLKYKIDDFAVTIVPISDEADDIVNRTFQVPPDIISVLSAGEGGGEAEAGGADPFSAAPNSTGARGLAPTKDIVTLLKTKGVSFPEGTSAFFNAANSTLIVRNTPTNMDQIETIVKTIANKTPQQISIMTKFVEVSQENTEELGFDWILQPFGIGYGGDLYAGGGTVGSGTPRTNADFLSYIGGETIDGVPAQTGQNVYNVMTAGNRSGTGAITRDSIDSILNNPNRSSQSSSVAPGILSLTGLFTDGQVQMIMRGLSQKKGADVMTAPSIMARSGEEATIEIIREFIYPTEYEPPELPNSVGASGGFSGGLLGGGSSAGMFPVTPATPTAFEPRNTGVTLSIKPTFSDNVINLTFKPEIVEFEGFINYGSPIQSPSSDALGNPTTVTITENRIEMPVFSVRRVTTNLSIFDGHTVAVGGLMREDVQNVEDKVPILGDIPYIGRLFQTKAENRIKSNLIVFVTAKIVDATGRLMKDSAAPVTPAGVMDAGLLPPPQ